MAINYKKLPVYEQKERILETLKSNQAIVVQSPTGSGKTTQIPVILYESGYAEAGMIAVTQPRRIAALSVSEFIAKQLHTTYPGLVGYKMRFEDKTDQSTKIKIMTDGILLQELKLDPWLSKYSVVMVDEAHERSLNIDFVLGLLKRILAERPEFKVIVSSATMNAEAFSDYFDGCPIVTIDTITYPVAMIYDPPAIPAGTSTDAASAALIEKVCGTVERILDNKQKGGILIFLPGEKIIKDCMGALNRSPFARKIFTLPLYGRLPKDEQENVFKKPPAGRKKIIISTNIAETSVTIADITTVIDSGLAKMNFYNPRTFTSSLTETAVSKASCNQRRGRAGRTCEGTCYRLYPRKDFDTRTLYTTEEIYRTDLSEVVLQMADLGITDFYGFDFISPPGREGIIGAVDTLIMLGALAPDNTLSAIGKMMVAFPLEPRISRIIVEAIMRFPDVLEQALIAASFLSANSPFVLPPGEEMEARKAHHAFRDMHGDFVSYLNIFAAFKSAPNKAKFCQRNYLDERIMLEIENINAQLSDIVSEMKIPISGKGDLQDYLCCIGAGMIQFVCMRTGRDSYRSITTDRICIHPGSVMFRQDPLYIVAGEIVRTSRMFAMSVSPLTKNVLEKISPSLPEKLAEGKGAKGSKRTLEKQSEEFDKAKDKKKGKTEKQDDSKSKKDEGVIAFGGETFTVKKVKGKKQAILPYESLLRAVRSEKNTASLAGVKGKIVFADGFTLLEGEKLSLIVRAANALNLTPLTTEDWGRKENIRIDDANGLAALLRLVPNILRVAVAKAKSREYGFICLFTDGHGTYYFKVSRGFSTAVNESLSSLETLADEKDVSFSAEDREKLNAVYRTLNALY